MGYRWWGADLDQERRRAEPPEWTNIARVTRRIQQYYPSKALGSGRQADFHIRVMVDADGALTSCHMTDLTTAAAFNHRACEEIMDHAQFDPALDVDGFILRQSHSLSVELAIQSTPFMVTSQLSLRLRQRDINHFTLSQPEWHPGISVLR